MGTTTRIAIAGLLLSLPALALADSTERGNEPLSLRPDSATPGAHCWIEHAQAQPVGSSGNLLRASVATPLTEVRGAHLGSEHWTSARQRACRVRGRALLASGG